MESKNRVVFITGSGRGIGEAVARWFMEHDSDVVLNYRRAHGKGGANIERLVEYANSRGVRAIPAIGDISDPQDVEKMFRTLKDQGVSRLYHLILNAAATPFKPFSEMTRNDWRLLVGTNLIGNVACVNQATELMPRGGTICAISSLGSLRHLPNYPLGVMKAALEQLIRYLEMELCPRGIRSNAVCAGFVNTDMLPILRQKWPNLFERLEKSGRPYIIEPNEVAEVVGFLTSKAASAVRGEVLVADAVVSIGI
ncbi:SDR family oxidoreductase [Verminephrobacter eiseniae]|uniref:SDR family oxidoreductase n=1 Tax=Verminephrobacter eiseniae TaxID=364317 RepID=UPI0022388DB3|nr:SDR family oxidoreductase [Verminephrobacter eiseniae]MCW5237161.1 SDR family oxidoreductase [Verminephrobacter eiseniae]